jgi:hypothetical protein
VNSANVGFLLTRPNNTLIDRAIGSLQEGVRFDTIVECRVVVVGNCRVNHDNVGLLSGVQSGDQLPHLVQRESFWISGEDMSGVHVVDISPYYDVLVSGSRIVYVRYSHMTSRGILAAV